MSNADTIVFAVQIETSRSATVDVARLRVATVGISALPEFSVSVARHVILEVEL
jgi:hypothetical protein